jgi:hypothetical protein
MYPIPNTLLLEFRLRSFRTIRYFIPFYETYTQNCVSYNSKVRTIYNNNNSNNNNNNNLLTASGLSRGGSGYFTFKLRQTY